MKPVHFLKKRGLRLALLLTMCGASGQASALDAATVATLAAKAANVAVQPDTPHVRELFGLYVLDQAQARCGGQPAAMRDARDNDAIFMAEVRSGLDGQQLDRLHAQAEAMTADPAFCGPARLARAEG